MNSSMEILKLFVYFNQPKSHIIYFCRHLEILHEAEELWQRQSGSDSSSEAGSISSGTLSDGGCLTAQEMAFPSPRYFHTPTTFGRNNAMLPPSAVASTHGGILI